MKKFFFFLIRMTIRVFDVMSVISHKNFTGRLPILAVAGGFGRTILGFSLARHKTLIFSIFNA